MYFVNGFLLLLFCFAHFITFTEKRELFLILSLQEMTCIFIYYETLQTEKKYYNIYFNLYFVEQPLLI